MAKRGKQFNFHGSFGSKEAAVTKEQEIDGAFIVERTVGGKLRWFVLTKK